MTIHKRAGNAKTVVENIDFEIGGADGVPGSTGWSSGDAAKTGESGVLLMLSLIHIQMCIRDRNKDIQVIEKFNPDMYKGLTQNLQVSIASKKYPAIVQMGYSYLNYAKDNFEYTAAQDVINKYFPEDKDFLDKNFLPNILELGQVDGEQVGIPYSISNPIMYINACLLYTSLYNSINIPF